ncbi:Variant SH3 domain containing protein [Brugia malayi]|uniref:Peroxisomal membrane protein PEX13 n=2 Tax=Brugia malayi TaxID=6279 RepID=A0A0K0JBM5_BRUMA|nr:Variant SH3 domain containing protein [Brugia malayi]CDP97321.1 BMA-PRX-13, isoform b [Brugia malayi]VIO92868.1 Variant SH3 domain containing protein [Brugia malayi]
MNYRCSWPNRPTTSPMTSCTCPHTFDHSSFPIRQVQSPTPVHTRCTFCTNAKNYTVDGKIAQLFGESTRGAFSSIEAVLAAVNSIADMLNATHHAVFNSFQAVFGALDEFGRLKTQIHCLLASTALLKWLRYIWQLLLKCLRLKVSGDAGMEEAWMGVRKDSDALTTQEITSQLVPSNPFRWLPSLMFWLMAIGVPYLMYQSLGGMVDESMKWTTGNDGYYEALATEDHYAEENDNISFKRGDILRVAPREYQPRKLGYILACSTGGKKVGLVPIKKIRLTRRVAESSAFTGQDAVQLFDDAHAFENNLYD